MISTSAHSHQGGDFYTLSELTLTAKARRGRTDHGQLHGAGHVSRKKTQKYRREGKASSPVLFGPIGIIPRVCQGVGQAVDPHFDPHHFQRFCNKKAPKAEVFDAFCRVLTEKMRSRKCTTVQSVESSIPQLTI